MKNKGLIAAAALCLAAVIAMVFALTRGAPEKKPVKFKAPDFDKNAITGTPTVEDESWMPIYKDGMDFSAHVCGRVLINNKAADLYFTNDEGNSVWMKLRIMDENGKILGETGLIKPGQYVKSVGFNTVPAVGTKIKMKIMTYQPETYYSAGAVTLNTVIGG